jgi:hypothetical protein
MIRVLQFLFLITIAIHSQADGCWSQKEKSDIEGFNELAGEVTLSLKDAVTCQPLSNALVVIAGQTYYSDSFGDVELEDKDFSAMDAKLKMKVSHPLYANYQTRLRFEAGTLIHRRFLLSKKMDAGKWRFVLTWPKRPRDLDLHLQGPDFHISYRDKKNSDDAKLDRDARYGFGPETITLNKTRAESVYRVFVHNYSSAFPLNGQATLDVYKGDAFVHRLNLPSTREPYVMLGEIVEHQFVPKIEARDRP